ncbi:hypothetical protein [Martelella mediterranea]|uniref:Uncharacterized protein n=1 Tax=Martelella mediterranea TaxID=293089 RepID=A0A4R3NKV0_9HYPH|nr:hypothetical protein [Martelella mediterranea]TCT34649.1 hypothetical protein EDC90_103343 [Martelella mediterranea]
MVARPGNTQAAYTAGELDPLLYERTKLKYFGTGLQYAENIVIAPQGGFSNRGGLRDIGSLPANAARIFPFMSSLGTTYDIVFAGDAGEVWSASSKTADINVSGLAGILPEATSAQRFDTLLLFHRDLKPKRIRLTNSGWTSDEMPIENPPDWDYGGTYTNGVAAVWTLEFVGLESGTSIFTLTVSQQETFSITFNDDMLTLITDISNAIADLPNVSPGFTVEAGPATDPVIPDPGEPFPSGPKKVTITFSGAGNEGDGWAVSGSVVNKADAAIVAVKNTVGISPGEPVISAARGWPQCGCFYNQRLIVGGFKSLPHAWMMSRQGDYFEFNNRFTEDDGPALIPMDAEGGESIERIKPSLYLQIFTSQAEYWIAQRGLSRNEAPNHVQSSRNGTARGVPISENEGASLYAYKNRATLGELRYTDTDGNFISTNISLLAPHLLRAGISDMAVQRATSDNDGNLHAIVLQTGAARLATILREQEVTAFTRMSADGLSFKACAVNGRNELSFITDRNGSRRLQRMEDGLLVDDATSFSFGSPTATLTGLSRFNGVSVWVIADANVFGPYTVSGGSLTLPIEVSNATVGTWSPPVVKTLPPSREVGTNTVVKRRGRIHSVRLSLTDTTSVAIGTNDGPLRNVNLTRYGMLADVGELDHGFTGEIKINGLRGYSDAPFVTVSQLRPGRLNVRSITVEAAL